MTLPCPFRHHTLIPAFQSLQLSAAVGLSRLGLITGLMTQPLEQLPEDADKRQVTREAVTQFHKMFSEISALQSAASQFGGGRALLHQRLFFANQVKQSH